MKFRARGLLRLTNGCIEHSGARVSVDRNQSRAFAANVKNENVVTNGAFGDIKETLGGYIIVKATSMNEAVEFAKGSPILQGEGNSIEVRKIAREDGIH